MNINLENFTEEELTKIEQGYINEIIKTFDILFEINPFKNFQIDGLYDYNDFKNLFEDEL